MRITPVKGTMEFFNQSRDDLIMWITHKNPNDNEMNRNFSPDTVLPYAREWLGGSPMWNRESALRETQ